MSDTHLIAVIGLVGALLGALLTSIALPILTSRLSYRPRLTVRVRCSNFSLPQLVENSALQYASGAWQKSTHAHNEGPIFRALCQSAVMYEASIKNSGRVACKHVDLKIQSTDSVFQVGKHKLFDPKKYTTVFARNLEIGDMQPGQEVDVTIWCPYESVFGYPLAITADELNDVKYIHERLAAPQPAWSPKVVIGLIIVGVIVGIIINKVFA
jgi:hypothetical protein